MLRTLWSIMDSAIYPILMAMSMWLCFLFNINYGWNLEDFGIRPHETNGLLGILTMPFLHENFEHLFSNTIPILVAGSFIFYYFKSWTWIIGLSVWVFSGLFVWLVGESGTNHIGASGLVYGLVFFLLISGIVRGHKNLAAVALLMVFLYGSLVWGIFPEYTRLIQENISWEGHMGGAIAGSILALSLLRKGPQKPIEITEPETDEEEGETPYWMEDASETEENSDSAETNEIKYRYVPKNANPWEKDD